jgi:regulator of protease activity HflC (stomatin/prohibitin superfamily)
MAKVIHAEGEAQAAEKLAEAAKIISVYPAAIHLRFLQTPSKVSSEKNSTVILPVPVDLLTAFLQKKEKE